MKYKVSALLALILFGTFVPAPSQATTPSSIVVIDTGQIIEFGDHVSLMKQNGIYAEMYAKQLADEIE
jgi:hypothetical protein